MCDRTPETAVLRKGFPLAASNERRNAFPSIAPDLPRQASTTAFHPDQETDREGGRVKGRGDAAEGSWDGMPCGRRRKDSGQPCFPPPIALEVGPGGRPGDHDTEREADEALERVPGADRCGAVEVGEVVELGDRRGSRGGPGVPP